MVFPNHFIGQLNSILSQKSKSSKSGPEQGAHHDHDDRVGIDHPTELGDQVIRSDIIFDGRPLEDDLDGEPMDDIDGEAL